MCILRLLKGLVTQLWDGYFFPKLLISEFIEYGAKKVSVPIFEKPGTVHNSQVSLFAL